MATAKKDPWYVADPTTKRTAPTADTQAIETQIAAVQKSDLPSDVKASAIEGLRSKMVSDKPFTLVVKNPTEPGRTPLIECGGAFKSKMLSPNLLRAIAENAGFVLTTLDSYAKLD